MNVSIITNEINLNNGQINKVNEFVKHNCSYYYFLNFIRITNGNVDEAIELYYFDEDIRKVLLKYILRLEVQMKKDLISSVETLNNGNTFWNNATYYKPSYSSTKGHRKFSNFTINVNKISAQMKKMCFSNNGPENNRAFYSSTFGSFIKTYQNLLYKYKSTFINKYMPNNNAEENISKYLQCIKIIRNRCCHSNHIVSIKLKNNISNVSLANLCNLQLDNLEKCILFIYRNLDNNKGFVDEFLDVLNKYKPYWYPYSFKHSVRVKLVDMLNLIKQNKLNIA